MKSFNGKKALENESTSQFFLSLKIWAVITNQNFWKKKCFIDELYACHTAYWYVNLQTTTKKWNTIIAWCSFFVCEIACFEAKWWWFISDSFFHWLFSKYWKIKWRTKKIGWFDIFSIVIFLKLDMTHEKSDDCFSEKRSTSFLINIFVDMRNFRILVFNYVCSEKNVFLKNVFF